MCIPYFRSLNSLKVWELERGGPKFHPTFKTCSNVRRANNLVIESFLKEGSNPWFCPSLRVFTDNFIILNIHKNKVPRWHEYKFDFGKQSFKTNNTISWDKHVLIHNIIQLIGCGPWNQTSYKYDYSLIPIFLGSGEHSSCVLWIFQQTTVEFGSFLIATFFIGNIPSRILLSNVVLSTN